MIFLALFLWQGILSEAQATPAIKPPVIRNISLFRNEIQLDIDKASQIKVGTKLTAQTAVNHKCLLVVKKIVKDLAYVDATQCPGYATLKKGQSVSVTPENEVNEEIKVVK